MGFEKLYTVNEIAKMTGLTARTIRNYIKDGRLNGKKIGVQWRFTKEDINELFKDQDVTESVEKAKNQLVIDYMNAKEVENISSCTIVEYPCSKIEEVQSLCNKLLDMVNEDNKIKSIKFSYQYFEEYKKARFIIIGEIEWVQRLLNTIRATKL